MSTNAPDFSSLSGSVTSGPSNYVEQSSQNSPTNYVEQASQNPAPEDVSDPVNGPSRLNSVLARIVGLPLQAAPPPATPSASSGGLASAWDTDGSGSGSGRPGVRGVVGALARAVSTGLSGIPDKGRPNAFSGLGEGARGAQQADATQQQLKFADFQTQVRLAQLTHQEKVWQNEDQDRQDQLDASAKAQVQSMGDKYGLKYDFVPNDDNGQAALTHLGMKQLQDGSVSLPEGVIAAPHGWYIPNGSSQEQSKANTQHYNDQAQFFGVPSTGGQPVNPKAYFAFNNQFLHGQNPDGSFMHSDQINNITASAQQRLDEYKAKPNADSQIVTEAQRHIDDLNNLSEKAANREANPVMNPKQQADVANENARTNRLNNPIAKPQKPQNVDTNGNPVWVPGVSADEKKKAELAENIAFNANAVASTIMKRPDILGAVAGRFTNAQQMIGNNDPDISALGVHIHNMAMANSGVHGFRSQEGVESYEKQLLNNFKNGPAAVAGALNASTGSVQTFVDNARPEAYKTHSKQGGAVRGMMGVQQ